jgi:oxygen-independent coproporphyrinogen-3 oxidase
MTIVNESSSNQLPQFTILSGSFQPNSGVPKAVLTANDWQNSASSATGAYIHVPFCFHKCHYCDFFSIAGKEDQHEQFVERLLVELKEVGQHLPELETVFIGGGTPTLLEESLFDRMLAGIHSSIPMSSNVEFSIEANPETVTAQKAISMVEHGINRVSIGAQSFNLELLLVLERWHEPCSVNRAVDCVHAAGIQNVNLDIIYSIPTQTIEQVRFDLNQAMALSPTHMSCYALTYELNTPLLQRLRTGAITRVDHDLEADMFDIVTEELESNGYAQYEISNYAKEGFTCKHNLMYWNNNNWWPFGPAAAGHIDGRRWRNAPRLRDYFVHAPLPLVEDVELLPKDTQAGEAFMMGLRLLRGMERSWVESLVLQSSNQWRQAVIDRNCDSGLLQWEKNHLALTAKGLHFADSVISEFLSKVDS